MSKINHSEHGKNIEKNCSTKENGNLTFPAKIDLSIYPSTVDSHLLHIRLMPDFPYI